MIDTDNNLPDRPCRAEVHASRAVIDYAKIAETVGGLTDGLIELEENLQTWRQTDPAMPAAFVVLLPTLGDCRRRLLTMAAAVARLAKRIET